jgi:hypothetical protein
VTAETAAPPAETAGEALPVEALLRRLVYEPRDGPLDGDAPPSPVAAARREFVDNARAICLDPARKAVEGPASDGGPPTVIADVGGVMIDLTLEPDGLLENLTTLYAIDGWGAIRRVTTEVDREVRRHLDIARRMAEPDADRYGIRASDPELDPRNQGGDASGVPRSREYAGQPGALQSTPEWTQEAREAASRAEIERWENARSTFEAARELLALAVVNALESIEGKANALAILRLNDGRNMAARAWARYGVQRVADRVVHAFPTPYMEYRFELTNTAERTSLKQFLQPLVEYIAEIKRLEELRPKAVAAHNSGARGGSGSDKESDIPTPAEVDEQLEFTRSVFEDILRSSRERHPIVAALMVSLKPGFTDRDMDRVVGGFLTTIRDSAEQYRPPPSRVVEASRNRGEWAVALDRGPEASLLGQVTLDGTRFDPLTQERLLEALLFDERGAAEPFETAVIVQYLDALARARETSAARAKAEAEVETLIMVLQIALIVAAIFLPALAPIALVVDAALAVRGAVNAVQSAVELEPTFRAQVQEQLTAVAGEGTIADMTALGEAIAAAPSAGDVALLLLQAGVSLRATGAALKILPTRRLLLWNALDLGMSAV